MEGTKKTAATSRKLLERVQSVADVTLNNERGARVKTEAGTSGVTGVDIISLRH